MASSLIKAGSSSAVVISTRNRLDELRKAVTSALHQTAKPDVVVMDDCSNDGTANAITREFTQVRVIRSEAATGYISQRNRAARLVSAPVIFSIDDDAVFSSPYVVEQTLVEFDHPRIGAVAIPFVDVHRGPNVLHKPPNKGGVYTIYSFIGTSHAVRRDVFLALGGYDEILVHQGEEEDYCTRMLNAGYVTRCGDADPVHHFESPRRSFARMDFYGSRNKILYAWQNVPFPYLPTHLAATTTKTLSYTVSPRRFLTRFRGVLCGYFLACFGRGERRPVAKQVYRLSRMLKKNGPLALDVIEPQLPPLGVHAQSEEPTQRRAFMATQECAE